MTEHSTDTATTLHPQGQAPKETGHTPSFPHKIQADAVYDALTHDEIIRRYNAHEELLEACKAAIAALSQEVQWSDGKGGSVKIIQGDCAAARNFLTNAIAKAEKGATQ
jgi:hypothetical protein